VSLTATAAAKTLMATKPAIGAVTSCTRPPIAAPAEAATIPRLLNVVNT
jgi:hypothetical protein